MEKTENKGHFPLFHSKSRDYDDGVCSIVSIIDPDSPTTKPEAPKKEG